MERIILAETNFIKTVAFGGYDKTETEKLFEAMNQKICELENELIQNNQLLENYKSDSDDVKNYEAVLSSERTKLSQLQVQNETLAAKNKELSSKMRDKELKVKELKNTVSDLKKKLSAADPDNSSDAAAMSRIFLEAQKTSDEMLDRARNEAEVLRKEAVRLAESIIEEANEKAGRIVSEAKEKASRTAQPYLNAGDMSENFSKLDSRLNMLKDLISDFEKTGMEHIAQCVSIISDAAENVKVLPAEDSGKTSAAPPEKVDESGNEAPVTPENTGAVPEHTDNNNDNSANEQYEDLQVLMAMAEALDDDAPDEQSEENTEKLTAAEEAADEQDEDLQALMAMAEALDGDTPDDQSEDKEKLTAAEKAADEQYEDLQVLMAMAEALSDE